MLLWMREDGPMSKISATIPCAEAGNVRETTVAFIGGARYTQPLDTTSAKKFRALQALGELFLIGFAQDFRPRRFTENAHFYLLPQLPLAILRYAEVVTAGLCLACWLISRHGVQVVVAQSPYEGFAAAWVKKIANKLGYKVKLVIESHGDFVESIFLQRHILFPKFYRLLMRWVARFTLRHADVLRVISHSTRQQLEHWAPGKPIYQFPTWTDIDVFLQAGAEETECAGQNILYTGVLIPRKGVHHLIDAFASISPHLPQVSLILVGHADNKAYVATLHEQVERLCLAERVQFVDQVPQQELAVWMRNACVFVLPSTSEGLGRVVIEAMATGLPVIGSRVGGIPGMIENGTTGFLVPPADAPALAERLCWVLSHPAEAHVMGCRARAFAKHYFSTAAYVHGYRQVIAMALALSTGRGGKHADTAF
jgi:glycosyltransferase involved in cell wall biosynthesis